MDTIEVARGDLVLNELKNDERSDEDDAMYFR